jgi:hypothetical protein
MTDDLKVLSLLSAFMDPLPTRAPEGLLRTTMTTVATTRQRRAWVPTLTLPRRYSRVSRTAVLPFAALVAALALLVVLVQVFSMLPNKLPPASAPVIATAGPSGSPTPASSASISPVPEPSASSTRVGIPDFEQPFTFLSPAGVELTVSRNEPKLVSLNSSNFRIGAPQIGEPTSDLYPIGDSGIVIASAVGAGMDSCPRHIGGQTINPGDDVPTLLTDYAGFTFTTTPTNVSGLPATIASGIAVDPPCLSHLHIGGNYQDESSTMLLDRSPGTVYLVPVGNTTVLIQIWGSAVWLPIADQIVDSIEFTDLTTVKATDAVPFASAPIGDRSESVFVKPFVYQLPDGVTLADRERNRILISYAAAGGNGISVASSADAWLDTCPSDSGMMDVGPTDDFASLLQNKAGFNFDATPTTIDGRPATLLEHLTTNCYGHLHVGPSFLRQVGQLSLGEPFEQVYVVPFADTTVVIQIWSNSQDELDSWLPIADQIVSSTHFSGI